MKKLTVFVAALSLIAVGVGIVDYSMRKTDTPVRYDIDPTNPANDITYYFPSLIRPGLYRVEQRGNEYNFVLVEPEPTGTHEAGFNTALDSLMLLDLELSLKGERKTWGEMADIVRKRHNIPKPKGEKK